MTAVTYLTDSAAKLVREIAAFASVEMEIREDSISVRATPFKAPPRVKGEPTLSKNGRIVGRPMTRRSPGGRKLKLFEFGGERLSVAEWAERYGVTAKAMRLRFARSGTPEAEERHSKSDRSNIKGKVTVQ